jgi:OOP family OmpA-OmpF porin
MPLSRPLTAAVTFTIVGAACVGGAIWAVNVIENRSAIAVERELLIGGEDWASARTDGLRVILTGAAESETRRFRALTLAGRAVDASRVIDHMTVAEADPIAPPRFSVEVLRNEDGVSLIGLIPETGAAAPLSARIARAAPGARVTDMLETTRLPAPEGWDAAVQFGLAALKQLPRSKISIAADRVAITAISDSAAEKRRLEREIAALAPQGISVAMDISAPRPVITPFTLRFIADENGMRFDACSADNAAGRKRILDAAILAGAPERASCTLGLGVPSPRWAEAAVLGIAAVGQLGAGSVTFSDADVSLIADHTVPQDTFDRVAGDLEARLPGVFSLKAIHQEPPTAPADDNAPPPTFTALRAPEGRVELRGRLPDELVRKAVDSFARAQFGADAVYMATRLDDALPEGWPQRTFAGLQALAELHHGSLLMRADLVDIRGVTGNPDASDKISRILSDRLGAGQAFSIDVRYDEALDPLANLPTPEECVQQVNDILSANKVTFDPGSA